MQLKRFLGNFAKTYLVIGALSVSAFAGADEFYQGGYMGGHPGNQGGYMADGYQGGAVPNFVPGFQDGMMDNGCCQPAERPCYPYGFNPPAYQHCGVNACNSFIDSLRGRVDFLWWRASENNLSIGTEETITTFSSDVTDASSETDRSRAKNPKFNFDAGFRLGLSTVCPDGCWDAALNWTHFHTKAKASGFSDFPLEADEDNTTTTGVFFIPAYERVAGAFPDLIEGRWTLDMDLVDLEIAHKFFVSRCLVLRPFVGLRGARIDQGYKIHSAANRSGTIDDDVYVSYVRMKNDFLGIGPRIGFDIEFEVGCGVVVFAEAAGSILYGTFDRHAREFYDDADDLDVVEYTLKSSADRCSRAISDLSIGLKWEHCFCWCNHYHPISLTAAWEHHGFYEFNDFAFGSNGFNSDDEVVTTNPVLSGRHGDLYTQGLTLSLEVGF